MESPTKQAADSTAAESQLAGPPALKPARPTESAVAPSFVVLTGNPNCGKTTVFNALTGLRARVGNYAGVTVERKEGRFQASPPNLPLTVLDLPGAYSLSPQSLDEQIARDVLFQRLPEVPAPAAVVVVVDASNLERNLYFATQVIELGYPAILALNMIDVAEQNGQEIRAEALAAELGAPVVPLVASTGEGIRELQQKIIEVVRAKAVRPKPKTFGELPAAFQAEASVLALMLASNDSPASALPQAEALLILSDEKFTVNAPGPFAAEVNRAAIAARQRLEEAGIDWRGAAVEARYARIGAIHRRVATEDGAPAETFSDKLDRVVTHRFWGMVIFLAIMAVMFLSIFTFAQWPMDLLSGMFSLIGRGVSRILPPGDLESLLEIGIVNGVGAVVAFLPQICLLFLFIGLLEDTGYMARAAFLMDRLMSKVGLHGKSFIPMLSSFACAIPGIMATRTIESPKDRLVTILVAPLMSCSARLPVYTLLIGACITGGVLAKSLTMLCMYLLGIVVALGMAWLFKNTLLKGETPMLVMELPPYRRPVARVVARHVWDRSKLFLQRAGTVILGINILLWFLTSYPKHPEIARQYDAARVAAAGQPAALEQLKADEAAGHLQHSYAGYAGRMLEPAIAPLGFDWKMGIGILSSFAAREVFVSTMSIVYSQAHPAGASEDTLKEQLQTILREQKSPEGARIYTPLRAVTLMVFYVLALQCVSTVAVVRRETNSWKWPLFQWVYMGALAWLLAFATWQGGRLLGFK
ncbi:MAG TPA: ferrous iron transport protein B [Verrucomicrobiae bacterium]|jgi:ferrous iron transport protein B